MPALHPGVVRSAEVKPINGLYNLTSAQTFSVLVCLLILWIFIAEEAASSSPSAIYLWLPNEYLYHEALWQILCRSGVTPTISQLNVQALRICNCRSQNAVFLTRLQSKSLLVTRWHCLQQVPWIFELWKSAVRSAAWAKPRLNIQQRRRIASLFTWRQAKCGASLSLGLLIQRVLAKLDYVSAYRFFQVLSRQ